MPLTLSYRPSSSFCPREVTHHSTRPFQVDEDLGCRARVDPPACDATDEVGPRVRQLVVLQNRHSALFVRRQAHRRASTRKQTHTHVRVGMCKRKAEHIKTFIRLHYRYRNLFLDRMLYNNIS